MKKHFLILYLLVLEFLPMQAQRVSLLFAGDAMQHLGQIENARTPKGYDYEPCFKWVKPEIESADFSVVNLEVPLGGAPYTGYPVFSAPDAFAQALKNAGFDLFLTANNHCLDRREKGVERTIMYLDSLAVFHTGTYRSDKDCARLHPLLLRKNGIRMAFLNYTYGTNGIAVRPPYMVNYIQTDEIVKDIETAKKNQADVVIICPHWGTEYQALPSASQRQLADRLVYAGANLIVGSHPHVLQPMETRRDSVGGIKSVVVYSLGNFISNMKTTETMGSVIFRVDIRKENDRTIIENPRYALIFTQRPVHIPGQGFVVIPASRYVSAGDSVPNTLSLPLNRFVNRARSLFKQHNKGIQEYIF